MIVLKKTDRESSVAGRREATPQSGFMSAMVAAAAVFAIMFFLGCSGDNPVQPNRMVEDTEDVQQRVDIFRLVDPDKGGDENPIALAPDSQRDSSGAGGISAEPVVDNFSN